MENNQIQLTFPENEFWQWVEVYDDKVIAQFDSIRHFSDIDQENLKRFIMVHKLSNIAIDIPLTDGRRLIHFYRNYVKYDLVSVEDKGHDHFRFPVVGYQITKNNTNFKVLLGLMPDGRVEVLES